MFHRFCCNRYHTIYILVRKLKVKDAIVAAQQFVQLLPMQEHQQPLVPLPAARGLQLGLCVWRKAPCLLLSILGGKYLWVPNFKQAILSWNLVGIFSHGDTLWIGSNFCESGRPKLPKSDQFLLLSTCGSVCPISTYLPVHGSRIVVRVIF